MKKIIALLLALTCALALFAGCAAKTTSNDTAADTAAADTAAKDAQAAADKAAAMGIGAVGLLVDDNNPKAEKLYHRCGFVTVGDNRWGGHAMRHLQKKTN